MRKKQAPQQAPTAPPTKTPRPKKGAAPIESTGQKASDKSRWQLQMTQLKHEAVMTATHVLLAQKGYEQMTMDEVAQAAGMSKVSLYKLYESKEALAAAAMVKVMDSAIEQVDALRASAASADAASSDTVAAEPAASASGGLPAPLSHIVALVRWAMQTQLEGQMPTLPAQNSQLSEALKQNAPYAERLFDLSMKLGIWIGQAQRLGQINPALPAEFVLYTIYARACDPVLDVMKSEGQYSDAQIIDWVLDAYLSGLAVRRA